jgi:hypothetical protein
MEDIIEELNKINAQLEEYFLEDESNNQEGFNKLIMVEFQDPKLKEALILMHSKYTAEIETLRKYHFKYLNKIVSINKSAFGNINKIKQELLREMELGNSKGKLNLPKPFITGVTLVFVLGSLFYMFTIDKEAGAMIVDIIKHGFSVLINSNEIKE